MLSSACQLSLLLSLCFITKTTIAFTPGSSSGTGTSTGSRNYDTTSPGVKTVNIGEDMDLSILVPPGELSRQWSTGESAGTKITTTNRGSGDVVWPSSFALAKLIAHCPTIVDNKRVLELGCGLGLPSVAALLHANPAHVALSDRDTRVLSLAYKSSTQLNRARASVSRSTIEWTDETSWPQQEFDILIGSDLLYERQSVPNLVRVLKNYLKDHDDADHSIVGKRALLVDPVGRPNRDVFTYAAFKEGMEVEEETFPGMEDFILLTVTWIG